MAQLDITGFRDKAGFNLVGFLYAPIQLQRIGVVTCSKSMAVPLLVPLFHICPVDPAVEFQEVTVSAYVPSDSRYGS